MAVGDLKHDASGNLLFNAAGNLVNDCCVADACGNCASGTTPCYVEVVFSDLTIARVELWLGGSDYDSMKLDPDTVEPTLFTAAQTTTCRWEFVGPASAVSVDYFSDQFASVYEGTALGHWRLIVDFDDHGGSDIYIDLSLTWVKDSGYASVPATIWAFSGDIVAFPGGGTGGDCSAIAETITADGTNGLYSGGECTVEFAP